MNRRIFLKSSAVAMVGAGAAPVWLTRALYADDAPSPRKKILVAIFQRGAVDGLNVVVPHGESRYYDLRPTIAIPRPGLGADSAIDLDGFFGLHPSLAALKPIYDSGNLAVIHAAGSPDPTRSHFDAQDFMESGTPGRKATPDGWLNRALAPEHDESPVRAVSMSADLPRTLRGANDAVAIANLNNFKVRDPREASAFKAMYEDTPDEIFNGTGRETFEAVKLMQSIGAQPYTPANGARYSNSQLARSMQQIAQIIKANIGLEVAFTDVGGWDTHVNEAPRLTNLLRDFGDTLAAFCQDLGDRMTEVCVVTMSEFGRTAKENGDRGTDHGHANAMFAFGGGIEGGKVYGDWPGLAPEQLYENRDLNLTTDFRDVLGELVVRHLGNRQIASVFPGFTQPKFRGLLRAA
ncbi:MAG: DUF1501 domain-containing protein [Bryobacteraceae bacterium]